MGYRICIPTLGKHGNRNDKTNILAKFSLFAYAVDYFPKNVPIGKGIRTSGAMKSSIFTFELLNLISKNLFEIIINDCSRLVNGNTVDKKRWLSPFGDAILVKYQNARLYRWSFLRYRPFHIQPYI